MSNQSDFLKKWLPSPRLWLGMTFMALSVGYIIKKHLDWKPNPDSKKRMLIHHLVFWTSGVPALKFLHKAWGELERNSGSLKLRPPSVHQSAGRWEVAISWLSAAAATLIGGFEGGERLARALVPKKPKPIPTPLAPVVGSGVYGSFPGIPTQAVYPFRSPVYTYSNRYQPFGTDMRFSR